MCTLDGCDPYSGCAHGPAGCSDNNPCTIDTCIKNACKSKPAPDGLLCPLGSGTCARGTCVADNCPDGTQLGAFALDGLKGFEPIHLAQLGSNQIAAIGHTYSGTSGQWQQRVAVIDLQAKGVAMHEAPGWQSVPAANAARRGSDGSVLLCGEKPGKSQTFAWFGRSKGMAPPVVLDFDSPNRRSCFHLQPTPDGGALLSGWAETESNVFSTTWLGRVDANDKVLWNSVINLNKYNMVTAAVAPATGQAVAAAYGEAGSYGQADSRLLWLDGQGTTVATVQLDATLYLDVRALIARPSGAITAIAGLKNATTAVGMACLRLDAAGNLLWSKANLPAGYLMVAEPTATGDLLVISAPQGGPKWLIGLNDQDEVAWQTEMNLGGQDLATDVIALADGRLAVAGLSTPSKNGVYTTYASAWLGLADAWGHLGCKAAGPCAGLTSCDDGDPCTADSCVNPGGCAHVALPAAVTCGQG